MNDTPKKILIAEDEKPLARALELKLVKEGYAVTIAYDGQEAIDAFGKDKFDLLLLDVIMPKVDGFEVLAHVKENSIPVKVMITTNLSQEEDENRAKELGATIFLVKSDTPINDLIERVKKELA